jgi:hypothetical protein
MKVRYGLLITLVALLGAGVGAAQDASNAETAQKQYYMKSSAPSRGPGGVMGFFGDGQTQVKDGLLLTSGKVTTSSAKSVRVSANGQDKAFRITPKTKICSDGKPIKESALNAGDGVSIVSTTEERDAISIRRGLAFMSVVGRGEVQDYDCK